MGSESIYLPFLSNSFIDTIFLELAIRLQIPLVNNDEKLRKAAKKAQVAL